MFSKSVVAELNIVVLVRGKGKSGVDYTSRLWGASGSLRKVSFW